MESLSQDDHGDFSSVNMDTAVAIRTLEATYKSSANAAAVETMILRLTERVLSFIFSYYTMFNVCLYTHLPLCT
jgi:hypothetical protein